MKNKHRLYKSLIAFALLVLINWVGGSVYWRVDLTADKRFTLSDVTKHFLSEQLDDELTIDLYLDGSVNSGFSRLEKATLNMIKQFSALNSKHITYDHILLDKSGAKKELVQELDKLQLAPMNVIDEDNNGKRIQKSVYPWAVVKYNGRQRAVKLLVNTNNRTGEENLNSSIEGLEYQFTETFRLLTDTVDRRIAFLEGHGELDEGSTYDITTSLSHYYSVDRGQIGTDARVLDAYEAVVIAQPTEAFTEAEKFVIDQYVMKGGKLLWALDGAKMSTDSLTKAEVNYAVYNKINLGDILFKYGVRINPDLLQDMQCALYPVNIASVGEPARFQPLPWFYSPLLQPNPKHPISRNISNVKAEFVSTLDVVGSDDLKKTVLLSSSAQSKVMPVPVEIDLGMSVKNSDLKTFNHGAKPVAVLLEGQFTSVFANRMTPKGLANTSAITKLSPESKMIVIADGSVIKNDLRGQGEEVQVVPLGYDYATRQAMFGNKDFLLNAVNYLTDDEGWFTLRQRTVKLRLLDKEQMERRTYYRILNVAAPLLLLMILALAMMLTRRYNYRK